MSRLVSYHALKCTFLLFSVVLTNSSTDPPTDYKLTERVPYLNELCSILEEKPPKNNVDCESLLRRIAVRYYGGSPTVAEGILLKNVWGEAGKPNNESDWKTLFAIIRDKYLDIDKLLKEIGLTRVPDNEEHWESVKKFMTDLNDLSADDESKVSSILSVVTGVSTNDYFKKFRMLSNIYFLAGRDKNTFQPLLSAAALTRVPENNIELESVFRFMNKSDCVTPEYKIKIKSINDKYKNLNTAHSKTEYRNDFRALAMIYLDILSEKRMRILSCCGFEREPADYKVAFNDLLDDYLALTEICKHLACGLTVRNTCDRFNMFYYAGEYNADKIGNIVAQFDTLQTTRFTNLLNNVAQLGSLTSKTSTECNSEFEKWEQWKENVPIDVDSKSTNEQEAKDLREAILRIWNAENTATAIQKWKEDRLIWVPRTKNILNEDLTIISKLSKLSSHQLRNSKIGSKKVDGQDLDFAISLFESVYRKSERFKKCLWILTYSTNPSIAKLKDNLERTWVKIAYESSRNVRFCATLKIVWDATSNADFHGTDLNHLPPTCHPSKEDFIKYVNTLGVDGGTTDTKDVIWSIMRFHDDLATTVNP